MVSTIRITNGGKTIHATGAVATELFMALTEGLKRLARHTHVNNGQNDACKECGHDLRNEIHLLWREERPTQ